MEKNARVNLVRVINETEYHSPLHNFQLTKATSETRFDPLTGQLSRLFAFRRVNLPQFDWQPYVEESRQRFCPFCPQTIEQATPRFPEELIPGGRLQVGDATVIPNLHPYEVYTAVVVMSSQHYLAMTDLNHEVIANAHRAGRDFLTIAAGKDPDNARYGSINWNYMPYAGGSLIHPHLQVYCGPYPSTYDDQMIEAARRYYRLHGRVFWQDLLEAEQTNGERYLGQTGTVYWLATFAPRGLFDVTAIIPNCRTFADLTDKIIDDLTAGMRKVIEYYRQNNVVSFNTALYFASPADHGFWAHLRMVARYTIYPVVGSDFSHLQVLHNDFWTLHLPEEMARELKPLFAD